MTKQLFISIILIFLAHNIMSAKEKVENELYSIYDSTTTLKNKKNILEFEILGKGGLYSLSYGRNLFIRNNWKFNFYIGYSFRTRVLNFPHSIPFSGEISFAIKKMTLNVGAGISILLSNTGTNLSREAFKQNNPELYRGGGGSRLLGAYHTNIGNEYYYSIGLSYKLINNFSLGVNYYLFNFYGYDYTRYNLKSYFGIRLNRIKGKSN